MTKLASVSRKIEVVCSTVASALMMSLALLIFAEVISRYIFQASHDFGDDLSVWLMVWLTYLMIGGLLKGRQHISIDTLPMKLPERYRTRLLIIFDIMSLIFAIILCWGGIQYSQMVKQMNIVSVPVFDFPMWIVRLCLPIGGIILAFFSIERLTVGIYSLGKNKET